MHKLLLFISLSFVLIGCGSAYYEVKDIPTTHSIDEQENIIKKIYINQSKQEIKTLIKNLGLNSFSVKENGKTYSYYRRTNSKTNVNFGILFVNNKLKAVILDDDTNDLFSCRTPFKTNNIHWLSYGIKPYIKWIETKDHLKKGINPRVNNTVIRKRKKKIVSFFEAIGYAPLLVAGAIVYTPVAIAESVTESNSDKNNQYIDKYELSKKIKLGMTENNIISKLGAPDQIDMVSGAKVLTYKSLSISYAVKNNEVIWKERLSMIELFSRQKKYGHSVYGNTDCGIVDDHWKANK